MSFAEEMSAMPKPFESIARFARGVLKQAKRELAERLIFERFKATGWNVAEGARRLGMERANLYRKMKESGISKDSALPPPSE